MSAPYFTASLASSGSGFSERKEHISAVIYCSFNVAQFLEVDRLDLVEHINDPSLIKLYKIIFVFCVIGKARAIFAREKGKAENYLIGLGFDKLRIFRPGYIYPVEPRKEPNFSYKLMRVMYKPFFSHFKSLSVTSHRLAAVMVDAAVSGRGQETMENKEIMAYGRKRRAKK